jgi:hypothetical protein
MTTESTGAAAPKTKPKYDAATIDAAIKRAQEQAGTSPAAKAAKKEKAEKAEKAPKEKPAKEPKEKAEKAEKAPKEKPAKEPKEKGPAHLNKVEKASANLPGLTPEAKQAFDRIDSMAGFTAGELTAIAAHLSHKARVMMTAGAVGAKPTVGALVEILPGDKGSEKYVGRKGRLIEVRSIRCFADVYGDDGETVIKKGLYLFTSGVKVIEEPEAEEPEEKPAEPEPETKEFLADEEATDVTETPAEVEPSVEAPAGTEPEPAATGTEG